MNEAIAGRAPTTAKAVWIAIKDLWWSFFDWVAVVTWKRLALVWLLVIMVAGIFDVGQVGAQFFVLSLAVKIFAGGKRRADLIAKKASSDAKVAKLERQLLEAQLSALQAQVEPHFLFNTLAMIGQLIETNPEQASKVHNNLVAYLRTTLPQIRSSEPATIGTEKRLAEAYLSIMMERMTERLQVAIFIPEEFETIPFPPMMIQLLVENAIKHGVEPKVEGGSVSVRTKIAGNALVVEVEDTGVGFKEGSKEGIGLANIRERLSLLYGNAAQFDIRARTGGGTIATISIPLVQQRHKA